MKKKSFEYQKEQFAKELGKRIKKYRKIRGFTQIQLGIKSGCSGSNIAASEKGISIPTAFLLLNISQALNVPIKKLLNNQEEEYIQTIRDPLLKKEDFQPYLELAKEAYLYEIPIQNLSNIITILKQNSLQE